MRYWPLAGLLVLGGCSATADRSFDSVAATACPDLYTLERADPADPPRLPAAIWRLAVHGTHDYYAELPVTFDVTGDGYVVNAKFDPAVGAPQSHNRHLRQSARDYLSERRYALPEGLSAGLKQCEDRLVYEFDNRYDTD